MSKRVVITGLGVVAPNGIGLPDFTKAIKKGASGIQFHDELKDLKFSCHLGGVPPLTEEIKQHYFSPLMLRNFNSSGILYGCIAGIDAWKDAGFSIGETVDYDSGIIFGTGSSGVEKFREAIYKVDAKKVRKLGSNVIVQTMASGVSAYMGGILGLGNQITTNSSACSTGTEAILMGYERIKFGKAKRMLVGSCNDHGPYAWGGFDAMRVLNYKHNDSPEEASRPMSASAHGFVPSSGAGALVLESLESAQERGATIYAEILGGDVNSGGQRNGGTLTAPNPEAVQRCIKSALKDAAINAKDIDLINGHLTATTKDPVEIENWTVALQRKGKSFPYIQSLKSMIGHCLAAAGAIESVASILQLKEGFMFPTVNSQDLHPDIINKIDVDKLSEEMILKDINIIAKASFGFGDVNVCIIFKKYEA